MSREAHWQKVYTEKASTDVSWFQADPALSKSLITKYSEPAHSIIDVGAGASLLVDQLIEAGYVNISLLDISAEALDTTKRRLGGAAAELSCHISDIQCFEPQMQYHVWHDRAVLHFLTNEVDQQAYKETLDKGLAKGGHFIVGTFAVGGPDKCSGLEIRQYDETCMTAFLGEGYVLRESLTEEHETPWGSSQKFAWFVFEKLI